MEFDTAEVSKIWRAKKFTVWSAALTIQPEDGNIQKCLLLVYHDGKKRIADGNGIDENDYRASDV